MTASHSLATQLPDQSQTTFSRLRSICTYSCGHAPDGALLSQLESPGLIPLWL